MADLTLAELTPADVADARQFLASWLHDGYPSMQTDEGRVFGDLLLRPAAELRVLDDQELIDLRRSSSILEIEKDPSIAEDASIDRIYSNFLVSRIPGAKASGQITVVITSQVTITLSVDTVFESGGVKFKLPNNVVAVAAGAVEDPNVQKAMIRRQDGTYQFIVDVAAVADGFSPIRRNALFSINPSPVGFITAFAVTDFDSGVEPEDNAQVVARFQAGVAAEIFSGRTHIAALIKKQFPGVIATSVIGARQAEMLRDRNKLVPTGTGGKVDAWVRTASLPRQFKITKTAVNVLGGSVGQRRFTIGRDDVPGFYTVDAVLLAGTDQGASTLGIVGDVRGLDTTEVVSGAVVPEMADILQGGYSRFQTSVVDFIDPAAAGDSGSYDIWVTAMPDIAAVQDYAQGPGDAGPAADLLIRAPVPAFFTATLEVHYPGDIQPATAAAVASAVAARVNALPFGTDRLAVSVIHAAAMAVLGSGGAWVASPIRLVMNVRTPDGNRVFTDIVGDCLLPDIPDSSVTPKTTAIYLDPANVAVSFRPSGG